MPMVDVQTSKAPAAIYPSAWEFDGLLTDGTAVCVLPIQRSDAGLLMAFHARLSPETIYRRYFGEGGDRCPSLL